MNMNLSLKIYYDDKIRIIPVSRKEANNYNRSLRLISRLTGSHSSPEVYYLDHEGDWIFVGSRKEWQFALKKHLISGQIKLKIIDPIDSHHVLSDDSSQSNNPSTTTNATPPPLVLQTRNSLNNNPHTIILNQSDSSDAVSSDDLDQSFTIIAPATSKNNNNNMTHWTIVRSTDLKQSLAQLRHVSNDDLERSELELSLQGQLRKNIELAKSSLNHVDTVEKHGNISGRVLENSISSNESELVLSTKEIHNRDVLIELGFEKEQVEEALRLNDNSIGDAFDYLLSKLG